MMQWNTVLYRIIYWTFLKGAVYMLVKGLIPENTNTSLMQYVDYGFATQIVNPRGKTKQIWDMLQNAKGVTVLHLLPDCNHYEAHSREYAIIKALGLVNLSNIYNGTCYGAMTEWNENEVVNFGNMILFNTLKMCLIETPSHVIFSDLIK